MRLRPKKIHIKISKILVRAAMEDAAMHAARREVTRQIHEQTDGTRLEGHGITLDGAYQYMTITDWPDVPDSPDMTFTWVD